MTFKTPNIFKAICLIMVLFYSDSGIIYSQVESGQTLDKIVAVVGKQIIMQSDIDARITLMAQQDTSLDIQDAEIRKQVLDAFINEKLIITKAIEDSVEVTEEEVDQRLEIVLQDLVRRYGSEKRIEDIYGLSIARLKFEYRDEIKKSLLSQKIGQIKFSNVKCSPQEVEGFFKEYQDSLQMVPPQVEVCHIVKYVKPEESAKKKAIDLANKVRDSILDGGDFAEFARRYSGDPGSAADGGNLGWFDKGSLFPEFEKAAFALQVGETSLPVGTPFGYHLIQTIDKKKDALLTRHILFRFEQSNDEKEKVKQELLELKKRAESGESFEELAKEYSDDKDTRGFGGLIGKLDKENLPVNIATAVKDLKEGCICDPVPYGNDPTKPGFNIVYLKKIYPEHKPTLDEDYKQIEQIAAMQKRQKLYLKWIEELRKEMYWEIKE